MNNILKITLILAVSIFVSACAPLQPISNSKLLESTDDKGYIFGTITQTFVEHGDRLIGYRILSEIQINSRLDSSQTYSAVVDSGYRDKVDTRFPGENGEVFVFELPAGNNQLDFWYTHDDLKSTFPKDYPEPFLINVLPGKIIYIGNIHFNLTFKKGVFDKKFVETIAPEIRHKFNHDLEILKDSYSIHSDIDIVNDPFNEGLWNY